MADYPTTIFTPRTTENLPGVVYDATKTKEVFAEDYSKPTAEIVAIETVLGTTPQGVYATVKAWLTDIMAILATKQNSLGYTAENIANKATSTSLGTSNTLYPSQNAVKSYVDTGLATKQNTIGYTPEDQANKSTTTTLGTSNTLYPTQNAVKTYVDSFAQWIKSGVNAYFNGGKIGIGNTNPLNTLHVTGSGDIVRIENGTRSFYVALDSGGFSIFTGAGQTGSGMYCSALSSYIGYYINGVEKIRVDSNGRIGIGTTSPGSSLAIIGLPTSSSGLNTGDLWIDTTGGVKTLRIV